MAPDDKNLISNVKPVPIEVKRQKESLPVYYVQTKLVNEIIKNAVTIIIGETGSGKTTQIPQFLHKYDFCKNGMIAVTQPRRVAAITVANRVAVETGSDIGDLVGYCVRFEDVTTSSTKLKFMTDGMLLREAMLDSLLRRYSVIIIDEAHERTVQTDVLLGVVKAAQKERIVRKFPFLKVIIMSATMDVDHFSRFFNNAPVIFIAGRQYSININYAKNSQDDYAFSTVATVFQLHRELPADHHFLVFLTGQDEIETMARSIATVAKELHGQTPPIMICPLFAALPSQAQLKAFKDPPIGTRKIVLSTNIAETSVTIDGIKCVIDCGMVKVRSHISGTGLDMLKVQRISQAQAWQRAGRAGRLSEGTVYRVYTEDQFNNFQKMPIPEVQRCNLTSVILQLLAIGIKNPMKFDFLDKPPKELLESAFKELELLGTIKTDEDVCTLTDLGKKMSSFPLDPRFSKALFAANELGCVEEMLSVISVLSSEGVFVTANVDREKLESIRSKFSSTEGDHVTLLNIYKSFRGSKMNKQWCYENFLNYRNLCYTAEIRKQLVDLCLQQNIKHSRSCGSNTNVLRQALLNGLFLNVAELQREGHYVTLGTRQIVQIHPSSVLFRTKPSYVLFTELVETGKRYIRQLSIVDPDWLPLANSEYFKRFRINEQ
ncbi:hypothetical protein QYM36_005128 [Artemia franciscana]|nr:hypothetical protein QYM36_005128 [Artemia franciscana]